MEKGKKLSLKRKIQPQKISDVTDSKHKEDLFNNDSIQTIGTEECVSISSESESEVQNKQRTKNDTSNERVHSDMSVKSMSIDVDQNSRRNFLDVDSVHLRALREVIMKTSQKYLLPISSFPDFPKLKAENGKQDVTLADIKQFVNKRIYEDFTPSVVTGELAPFPAMCDWCRRRKPLSHDVQQCTNIHEQCSKNLGTERLDMCLELTDVNNKSIRAKYMNSLEGSINDKLNILQQTEAGNMTDIHITDRTNPGENKNANTCGATESNPTTGACSIPDTVIHTPCDVLSDEMSSTCTDSHSVSQSKPSTLFGTNANICRTRNLGFQDSVNNSHLMKDRNSNYYALQSQNNTSSSPSSRSAVIASDYEMLDNVLASGDSKGKIDRISYAGAIDQNNCEKQRFSKGCDTLNVFDLKCKSGASGNINSELSRTSKHLPESASTQLKSTSSTHESYIKSDNKMASTENRSNYVHPYLKTETRPVKTNRKPIFSSKRSSPNVNPRSAPSSGDDSSKTLVTTKHTASKFTNDTSSSIRRSVGLVGSNRHSGEATLKSCPLCQMEFQAGSESFLLFGAGGHMTGEIGLIAKTSVDPDQPVHPHSLIRICTVLHSINETPIMLPTRRSQMEIDSHIAVCLEAAGDDIVW